MSKIRRDIYFLSLVRLTDSDFIYDAIYFNGITYCWPHKDDSVNKRLFCLLYFSFSCENIQMHVNINAT